MTRPARASLTGAARRIATAPKDLTLGFGKGLTYPFRGAKLVYLDQPGLIRYWIWPILLTGLGFALMTWGAWEAHDDLLTAFEPAGEGFWADIGRFFYGVLEVLVFLVLVVAALLFSVLLTSVIAAPFNDALSEEVERLATGVPGPPFRLSVLLKDVGRTIGLEITKVAMLAGVMVPLWLVSILVPVVGQAAYSAIGFVFTAVYFAIDYVDWPAARRELPVSYRFGLARSRFSTMFGFGTGVWAFLFIPLVNLLFMPAAVAGGTLLFLDLEALEKAHSQPASPGSE